MSVIFHMLSLGHEEIHLDREATLNRQWEVVEYRRQNLVKVKNWTAEQAARMYKRPSIIPSLSTTMPLVVVPSLSSAQVSPRLKEDLETRIESLTFKANRVTSTKGISPASYRKFMMQEVNRPKDDHTIFKSST